jgi:hypothetical protein
MRRWSISVLAAVALWGAWAARPAAAQQIQGDARWLRYASSYVRLAIHSGRIAVVVLRPGGFSTQWSTQSQSRKEQVTIQYNVGTGAVELSYRLSAPDETMTVTAATGGRVTIRREPAGKGSLVPGEFVQEPGKPLVLSVGKDAQKRSYEAATIWQLLLAHCDECKQYVVPGLDLFRPEGKLLDTADAVEKELLRAARAGELPDQRRWTELVAQLGDDRFARREAADRDLRAVGRPVVPFLSGLDRRKLDAEQQYRIQRIIRSLSSVTGEETPQQVAGAMVTDPTIWLVFLGREQASTRSLAAKHLERLLGGPIDFDPAANAATRGKQIESLARRIAAKRP